MIAEARFPDEGALRGVGMDEEGLAPDAVDVPFRSAGVLLLGESVTVFAPERLLDVFLAIDVDGFGFQQVEGARVVQASGVVLVVVGEQDGIQVPDPCAQHLIAEIGAGVHQDRQSAVFHQGGGAQAFVTRVGGAADRAFAADHRYALGGPCTQEGQFGFFHIPAQK